MKAQPLSFILTRVSVARWAALLFLLCCGPSRAAVIVAQSYLNDFTASAGDFDTTLSSAWTLNTSGSGTFGHNAAASAAGNYYASVQHSLMGGAPGGVERFSFSGEVAYNATGVASGNRLGLAFLGGAADFTDDSYQFYVRGVASGGASIFLTRNGENVDADGSSSRELRDFFGHTMVFTISGLYVGDSLSIDAVFSNRTTGVNYTLNYVDASPLTGNRFGLMGADQSTSLTFDAQWNYFSLNITPVIPEPGTAMLMGIGLAGLGLMRRRRRGGRIAAGHANNA